MKPLRQLIVGLCLLSLMGGCASTRPLDLEPPPPVDQTEHDKAGTWKKWMIIGGALLVGAVIAGEAEDGAKDALRDAVR